MTFFKSYKKKKELLATIAGNYLEKNFEIRNKLTSFSTDIEVSFPEEGKINGRIKFTPEQVERILISDEAYKYRLECYRYTILHSRLSSPLMALFVKTPSIPELENILEELPVMGGPAGVFAHYITEVAPTAA